MALTIFLNRRSGSVTDETESLLRGLLGPELRMEYIAEEGLQERISEALELGQVVAAGGDGTVSAVAGGMIGSGKALGIVPLGTLNHLARDLNIPNDLEQAAKVIQSGRLMAIDTGCVNDRPFVNNSSMGLYPRLVLYRESLEKRGLPRWAALCKAAGYILTRYRTVQVEFEMEDRRVTRNTPLVFVGNNIYSLTGIRAGSRESLCDGVLTVIIARQQSVWAFLWGTLRSLAGLRRNNDSLEVLHLTSLTVKTPNKGVIVSTDGEVHVLTSPLRYSIRPRSLNVLVPAQ